MGVLPYFSYIGMCHRIGYGFRAVKSLNRVSHLALCSFDRVPKSQVLLKTRTCCYKTRFTLTCIGGGFVCVSKL